jgi:dimethylhistidine N-methyltransferase
MTGTFAKDVDEGLSASPKQLSPQYFYDDNGSRIFQQIMAMPEYYLTDCECEILQRRATDILNELDFSGHFNVIELGTGDGSKTRELLAGFMDAGADISYVPIDISAAAIDALTSQMAEELPGLKINPQVGDYFDIMDKVEAQEDCPNLVLFLGANIGNYTDAGAVELLQHFGEHMRGGDRLLVGFDLQKNPVLIHRAYDDPHGITRQFNLNLLARINKELAGEFKLEQFSFFCCYEPASGEVTSYLVSLCEQVVYIGSIGKEFSFERNELIFTELSRKHTLTQIEQLGESAGFEFAAHFLDQKEYFSDTLFFKP